MHEDIVGGIADEAVTHVMGQGDDEDIYGDVLGDPEVLGAIQRAKGRRMRLPGVQTFGERRQWLPFPVVTFVNAGLTVQQSTRNGQRPFRGRRIVVTRANVGAASPNLLVTVTQVLIANVPQALSVGGTPVEAFAATAFDLGVDLDSTQPGVDYTVEFTISAAPAVAETVTLSTAIFGSSLR